LKKTISTLNDKNFKLDSDVSSLTKEIEILKAKEEES